jgi:hypothetical protein
MPGVPVTGRLPSSTEFPDFMENQTKMPYESQKILGQLYNQQQWRYYKDCRIEPLDDFIEDDYMNYVDEALNLRNHYNHEIRTLMKRYKIKSEAEVFTGNLLSVKTSGRKLYDVRDAIASEMALYITKYRRRFKREFEEEGDEYDDEIGTYVPILINHGTKAKASAWYMVTYDTQQYPNDYDDDDDDEIENLISFPWIVSDILLDILKTR